MRVVIVLGLAAIASMTTAKAENCGAAATQTGINVPRGHPARMDCVPRRRVRVYRVPHRRRKRQWRDRCLMSCRGHGQTKQRAEGVFEV
jgi:hypothetical protein